MADFKFNMCECLWKRDWRGVGENIFLYGVVTGMFVAIPFLVLYRYVRWKIYHTTTKNIDVCEKCVGKFLNIPFDKLRPWVGARCKVCSPNDTFQFHDACEGGPDRCQRLTPEEYEMWSKKE